MPKKILVGVLNWGLGHATRCIPVISYLSQFQCQIFVAANGGQRMLLEEVFPTVKFLEPPPYTIKYPLHQSLVLAIGKQLPKLHHVIREEHRWLLKVEKELGGLDMIISDNRYGLHHPRVPSVIMTHQLSPRSGMGAIPDALVRKLHYRFLSAFGECWVPDMPEGPGLAGMLSHPPALPGRCRYIGPLSRFTPSSGGRDGHLLVLLSGPEPVRTHFEEQIRRQLSGYPGKYILVRGLPESVEDPGPGCFNHVDAATLGQLITDAHTVICRSGYTTIMDLCRLEKKAMLVPTPGQTEQEYLARHAAAQGLFPFMEQHELDIMKAIDTVAGFTFRKPQLDFHLHRQALHHIVNS